MKKLEKFDLFVNERSSVCGAVLALDLESGHKKAHATCFFNDDAGSITIVQWDYYAELRAYVQDFISFDFVAPKVGEVVTMGVSERAVGLW